MMDWKNIGPEINAKTGTITVRGVSFSDYRDWCVAEGQPSPTKEQFEEIDVATAQSVLSYLKGAD